jgi:hypothetical protein
MDDLDLWNIGDKWLWFCRQIDPDFNPNRMQDATGRLYFIEREVDTHAEWRDLNRQLTDA